MFKQHWCQQFVYLEKLTNKQESKNQMELKTEYYFGKNVFEILRYGFWLISIILQITEYGLYLP